MKKTAVFIIAVILCTMCLTGCGGYRSKYEAVALVHSNTPQRGELAFSEFKGTYVFKLKRPDENAKLAVGGKLQSGSLTVYVDHDGKEREFLTIDEPGKMQMNTKKGLENETIYVIVQADNKCYEGALVIKFM